MTKEGQLSGIGQREVFEVDADKIVRVRRGHVAVIPIEDSSRTESGLYIPEEAKQRADHGVVLVRGTDTPDVRTGDHVVFSGYSGTKVSLRGQGTLIVMPVVEVLLILPEKFVPLIPVSGVLDMVDRVERKVRTSLGLTKDDPEINLDVLNWIREELDSYERSGFEF